MKSQWVGWHNSKWLNCHLPLTASGRANSCFTSCQRLSCSALREARVDGPIALQNSIATGWKW